MSKHKDDCAGRNGVRDHGKHTPGLWKPAMMTTKLMNVLPHRIHGFIVQIIGGPDAKMIAHAHGRTEKECEANARLIAAAPELLEALRALMAEYTADNPQSSGADNPDCSIAMIAAHAAIAKAEGRSDA